MIQEQLISEVPSPYIDENFEIDFANEIARLETYNKHLYRPNTYLHKWWARRCGTTFRLILKHLAEEPDTRGFYSPGGLEGKLIKKVNPQLCWGDC